MTNNFNIRILVTPLDWGLGHATRCIPIIQHLLDKGCNVFIGAEGSQKSLLEKEFPSVKIIPLEGYRIKYTRSKRLFAFKIIQQLPTIIHTITTEQKWLQTAVKDYGVHAVISDNRYGLYHSNIHSILITHQLCIKAPFKWLEKFIQVLNYKLINRFSECWVPDEQGNLNIAGKLSHVAKMPAIPVKYLGGISRFTSNKPANIVYDFLAVVSGPEPQRFLLEQKILSELKDYKGKGLIVRGLPSEGETTLITGGVSMLNHLPSKELEAAFNASEFIIARSGYTTLMDIIKLKKKSILIPTPGQTEQEYLADHLHRQEWAMKVSQENFKLNLALQQAKKFNYHLPTINMENYKVIIDDFINTLQK